MGKFIAGIVSTIIVLGALVVLTTILSKRGDLPAIRKIGLQGIEFEQTGPKELPDGDFKNIYSFKTSTGAIVQGSVISSDAVTVDGVERIGDRDAIYLKKIGQSER